MNRKPIEAKLIKARELLGTRAFSLPELAAETGLSASHLQKTFKQAFGLSPAQYAAQRKLASLKKNLRTSGDVTQAWVDSGFGSCSRVYEHGAAKLGMLPAQYKKGGAGLTIHWTVCASVLGTALVAATERGICAIALGPDKAILQAELEAEFPAAQLNYVPDDHRFIADKVQQAAEALAGKAADVPLELLGTAFQHKVWQALMKIPKGQTLSYAELAQQLDMPKAARAVARACAGNKVAVLVPCHRIIRGDGSLGGYRWGLPLKEKILRHEGACDNAA
jgi:AraC family transcriptional regulator, regulatory protein of adaptative response / methylated-DNA-[protein]-cysteine methyltransferase